MNEETYSFKDIVYGMATLEGKKMKEVARDLQCDGSVLSNILAKRFRAREKEELLEERTRLAMYDLFEEVLGNLSKTTRAKIDEFTKEKLENHQTQK